ncbi:MAG: hypothetical protein K9M45_06905 [Kiritimatiellales bacterium]|nr:hypothetical protein [Kiritimatiellales bacterium]
MNRGFIKLWRVSFDNKMYFAEPFTRWQAWLDLLLLANHKDRFVTFRGVMVEVKRGQVATAERFLADRWQWSRGKVRRFLNHLESARQIVPQKSNVLSIYTIAKWEVYQGDSTADDTTNSTTDGPQTDRPKKGKNVNKSICAKPQGDLAPEEVALSFPVTGQDQDWHLTKTKLAEYESTFDTLDVLAQCRRALQWIKDNPSKRKTTKGMTRFLGSWLTRAANDPRTPKQECQQSETYTGAVL